MSNEENIHRTHLMNQQIQAQFLTISEQSENIVFLTRKLQTTSERASMSCEEALSMSHNFREMKLLKQEKESELEKARF